ncbi:hypothetical protein BYT27DRAFT_7187733 [Phlegmacium glaucopus]|nr:hypothetical protein BYT27DRAFT_7187733 [Phlegmacium glaucopus]
MSDTTISRGTYRFRSKNTGECIVTSKHDVNGNAVKTVMGDHTIPDLSMMLTVTPAITGDITEVTIKGFNNLYISLQGDAENTKLTWCDKEYKWIIRATQQGTNVITPADGHDLYWVNELNLGAFVVVKAGRHIQAPQNEWMVTKA